MAAELALLFVYGTLRPGAVNPMARWLGERATHVGAGEVAGTLYRVADYPGMVAGGASRVMGDLFLLGEDAEAVLAALDEYEECSDGFPAPLEYRREVISVDTSEGARPAWTWIYARPVDGLDVIASGDYLGG